MKMKVSVLLFFMITMIVQAVEPVKVNDSDIMLLAHFNSTAKPESGISEGMANRASITAGEQGMKFTDSMPRPEALDLTATGSLLALPGKGNIDVNQGTMQFWFKPRWSKTGYNHCRIFQFGSPVQRGGVNWRGHNAFYFQKPAKEERVQLCHNGKSIAKELPHSLDTWYQMAATWDAGRKTYELYIDGELVGSQPYKLPDGPPAELHFGAPDTHRGQVYIDELRILKRVLTAAEIKQDYEAQKEGHEFASPVAAAGTFPVFQPVPPEADAAGSVLLDIDLPVYLTAEPMKIDGNPDKACWKKVSPLPTLVKKDNSVPKAASEIKLLYDRNNLYIMARFAEPQMNRLSARFDQRDLAIYSDDCLEFLILTPGNRHNFFHFAVNAIGSIFDTRDGRKNWNAANAVVKNIRGNDFWTVEMQIPFKDLGIATPQIGENWGARFCRERHGAERELSSVPRNENRSFSDKVALGKLCFMGSLDGKNALECSIPAEKFMPGCNPVSLKTKDLSGKNAEYMVTVTQYGRKSEILGREESKLNVAAGGTAELPLVVKVDNDETERVAVGIADAGGNAVYSRILERGYKAVEPSIRQAAVRLARYQENAGIFKSYRHPLYMSVVESVELLVKELQTYREKLDRALNAGEMVSEADYEHIAAMVNGFNRWLEGRRYLVWQTSPWEVGSPDAIAPLDYNEKMVLKFNQAGNEREAVCLVISGLLCDKRMDLRLFAEPIKQDGKFISSDSFRIYTEEFVDHLGSLSSTPLIQAPGNIITVTPGHSLRVWVVFDSKGVEPGNYAGVIKIKPLYDYSLPNRELPVALRIFNFALPETRDWPLDCFFWTGKFTPLNEPAMVQLVHDYHIKWVMTESENYKNGFINDRTAVGPKNELGYDPRRAKTANEEFFRLAKQLGMRVVFAWGTSTDVQWHQLMSDRLKGMGFDYGDFMFHGALKDEFHASDIPKAAELRKQLKAADPNWQFMATLLNTPPPSGATLQQIEQAGLPEFFKFWSVISSRAFDSKQGPETINLLRKHGGKVWAYRCSYNMQTQDVMDYYRIFLWESYLRGFDGAAFWTLHSTKNDGFDHRDGYDDGITWRGIDKNPIPTKRFEVVREGLEDVAYMDILKKRLEAVVAKNPGKNYAEYRKLITERPRQIIQNRSQDELERWRLEMLEAIEQLGKELL